MSSIDPAHALELAVRADENAKGAHDRLDRMNGSIDRLATQVGLANGKLDTLAALQVVRRDAREATYFKLQNVGVAVAVISVLIALLSLVFAVALAKGWLK